MGAMQLSFLPKTFSSNSFTLIENSFKFFVFVFVLLLFFQDSKFEFKVTASTHNGLGGGICPVVAPKIISLFHD